MAVQVLVLKVLVPVLAMSPLLLTLLKQKKVDASASRSALGPLKDLPLQSFPAPTCGIQPRSAQHQSSHVRDSSIPE